MSEKEKPSPEVNPIQDLVNAMNNVNGDADQDFIPTTDVELTHEIVQTLFDPSNLNMITSLSKRELSGIMKLHTINDIIHQGEDSVLTRMLYNYKTLKISDNRLGRKELIQAIIGRQSDEQDGSGFISKYIR